MPSSSTPIKLGIVGVGKIVRDQHLPALAKNPDYRLVAAATEEDGCGSQLKEKVAYAWFIKKNRNYKDCVDCTNQIMEKAGAFQYYGKWITPTTPGQFVGWAGDIQKSMIKSGDLSAWPTEPDRQFLFRDDDLRGRTVIPWGYGGGIGNNKSGRQRLGAMTPSRLKPLQNQGLSELI